MSSMRNVTQRRNHRERGQPLQRQERLGLLEKHKDYSRRAKDYNEKKQRLKILRQKAAERNADEFSFGMISNKSKQGRKIADRQNPVLSQDVVKLLKTQDAAYLKTMLGKTRRAREKLEQEFVLREGRGADVLGITSDEPKSMHTIFVESKEEQRQYGYSDECVLRSKRSLAPLEAPSSPKVEKAEGADHDIFNKSPQSRRITARRDIDLDREAKLRKKHRKERGARSSKLQALRVREKDLIEAEHNLELQRSKMNNSVGGVTKAGLKWRVRERKK